MKQNEAREVARASPGMPLATMKLSISLVVRWDVLAKFKQRNGKA